MALMQLERRNGVALYQQIADQLKERIDANQLTAGSRLPTIRQLADELGVTRVTVQNAYDELQATGWIEATVGRGTFVSRHPPRRPSHAGRAMRLGQSLTADAVVNELLQIHQLQAEQHDAVRSLALASPDPRLFPIDLFKQALGAIEDELPALLCYGSPQGDLALRQALATELAHRGIASEAEAIIVTNGVTQGLSLVAQTLARPGDRVLVEEPTYLGALNLFKAHRLEVMGVPLDEEGPQLAVLERYAAQYRPRFFYTIPAYQNPTGSCISEERKAALLVWAARHGIVLIEDDIYGRLAYEGAPPPTLKQADQQGLVVYLTSESKVLFPGTRTGTIVAPHLLHERILTLRRATDLCGGHLLQRALAHFLQAKGLQLHLRRVLPIYRRRRDVMLSALRRHMPPAVTWTQPRGGYCVWLTMPRVPALHDIQQATLHRGLAIAPGEVFLPQAVDQKHLRLAFSYEDEETIGQCVRLLAQLISERLSQDGQQAITNEWTPLV